MWVAAASNFFHKLHRIKSLFIQDVQETYYKIETTVSRNELHSINSKHLAPVQIQCLPCYRNNRTCNQGFKSALFEIGGIN